MLSPQDSLDLALAVWNDSHRSELTRLNRIKNALRTRQPSDPEMSVEIPDDAPDVMRRLARKAETNYLPLLVRTYRQALRVDGYLTKAPPEQSPWRWWEANGLGARQSAIHDPVLRYGCAYVRVVPGVRNGHAVPAARIFDPFRMAAVYEDALDEWPVATVHQSGTGLVLTDPTHEYSFGVRDERPIALRLARPLRASTASYEFLGASAHEVGHCPVVRYRDSFLPDPDEGFGIVEPLIVVQQRIDETQYGQLVAQFFTAFQQRSVIGWVPASEAEELKASAARVWYVDAEPDSIRIQELKAGDLQGYAEAGSKARRDFAAIGQVAPGDIGVDSISNISDATLAGLEASKNRRAGEIATSLGESHEQALRLMALIAGDMEAAADYASEVRWAEREARSWAGTVDGLVKLVQAQVLSPDMAIEMVPGMTEQQARRAQDAQRRAQARASISALTQSNADAVAR